MLKLLCLVCFEEIEKISKGLRKKTVSVKNSEYFK